MRAPLIACALCVFASGCLDGDPSPLANDGGATTPSGTATGPGAGGEPPEVAPSGQCSKSSSQAVTLTFRNRSPNITMNLFWVDFSCKESRYATLAPGASHVQPTFTSHPWHLRDAGTNALYKEFIPVSGGETLVEVP